MKLVLDFLEEVGSFLASFFGVVHRDMGGFLGSFFDVLACVFRSAVGQLKCVFRTVLGFYCHALGGAVDMGDGSVHRLETFFADVIDLDRCLLGARFGVVRHYFCAFLESVKGVFGTHLGCLGAVNRGPVDKLDRMLAAILGLDDHRLGG